MKYRSTSFNIIQKAFVHHIFNQTDFVFTSSIQLKVVKSKAKSGKYRGVFIVESEVKKRHDKLEKTGLCHKHKQVPKGGQIHVSGMVSVPCWHAPPIAKSMDLSNIHGEVPFAPPI